MPMTPLGNFLECWQSALRKIAAIRQLSTHGQMRPSKGRALLQQRWLDWPVSKATYRALLLARATALYVLELLDYVSRIINGKEMPPLALRRYVGPLSS